MILSLVFTSLLSFLMFVACSKYVVSKTLIRYTLGSMISCLFLLVVFLPKIQTGNLFLATLGVWIAADLFEVSWTFSIDALTYVRLFVVLIVSTLVHLYSTEYRSEDPHLPRFLSYLSLFTFFRLLLITSDNFVGLFLGWEGVGLCSYLLISFWFTRIQANKAAIKAMIVNRIADLAFTIGVLAVFSTFQTVEFSSVFGLAPFLVSSKVLFSTFVVSPLTLITSLLFLGARGKSAQIGLHTWLPDAREGPTPVSALIHAATRVTAGVFLVIRCSYLFECVPAVLTFITCIGAGTSFRAATAGLVQNDLKKVIAYSTCSQLGYMLLICGLSEYALSLFHLTNHAFFKALLFLSAGAVIHSISNEQDLRRFGGLIRILPYTYVRFIIGSLALRGFPFLTGFYSKDIILEVAGASYTIFGTFAHWLGLVTAFFTAFYSFRLIYLAFYGVARPPRAYFVNAHELTARRALSLAILSLGSIFLGYLARDLFIGFGTDFWAGSVYVNPALIGSQLSGEFLPVYIKRLPFFGSITSVFFVFACNETWAARSSSLYKNSALRAWYRFLSHKWYFDTVYNRFVNQPLLEFAYKTVFRFLDKGLLEFIGPTSAGRIISKVGFHITRAQTGKVYDYALFRLVTLWTVGLLVAYANAF